MLNRTSGWTTTNPGAILPRWACALLLSLGLGANLAHAATLTVTVTKADGQPATDTVVMAQPASGLTYTLPASTVVVNQKDLRFDPYLSVVPMGATVRFTNLDRYDHHVRSMPSGPLGNIPPAKSFELRLNKPQKDETSTAELKMDVAGVITLGCHIHGSMRGHLFVSTTPWAAVTDDKGQVTLSGVPAGGMDLHIWHPDQLTEQPAQRLQVASNDLSATAKLNFSPRKRRVITPAKDEYAY